MTSKVVIQYPTGNHAPSVEIRSVSPTTGQQTVVVVLKQGEETSQYVHSGQNLLIVERFE